MVTQGARRLVGATATPLDRDHGCTVPSVHKPPLLGSCMHSAECIAPCVHANEVCYWARCSLGYSHCAVLGCHAQQEVPPMARDGGTPDRSDAPQCARSCPRQGSCMQSRLPGRAEHLAGEGVDVVSAPWRDIRSPDIRPSHVGCGTRARPMASVFQCGLRRGWRRGGRR